MPIQQPGWTPRDEALLHTCRLAHLMITGGDPFQVQEVLAPFPPQFAGERLWASGPFTLWDWRALGDGSPEIPPTSLIDFALGSAAVIKRLFDINRAVRRAAEDSIPRWVKVASGRLYTSAHGFYFYTDESQPQVYPWPWEGITSAELLGPGSLRFTGTNRHGPVTWLLTSDWSELVFVTWALARHPKHPQLLNGWLPPGWIEHARSWNHQV